MVMYVTWVFVCVYYFCKKLSFSPFYSNFKMKSRENSCKNYIFIILSNIDFKYTKRRWILCQSNVTSLTEIAVFHIS